MPQCSASVNKRDHDRLILSLILGFSLVLAFNPTSLVQAAAPITPSGLNTQVTLSATPPAGKTQFDITGGTRPGGGPNLFHSFGQFNVPNNNFANFLNDSGLATSNILGRVTGGNISNIFGTIQTTGFGNANLFMMNPAGFLFGPNATINVGGMVSFTSADYLRLADGVRFTAAQNAATDALLSAAPVAAFGFLGSNPGAITVQGSQFTVTPGTGISLVGGNITVQNGTLDNGTVQAAKLSAPGGQITVASLASAGELSIGVPPAGPTVVAQNPANVPSGGTIQLTSGALLQTSSSTGPAGSISIRGGQLVMENATLEASTSFKTANPAPASTNSGNISIQADSVSLSKGTTITTSTSGDVNAGNITFEVGTLRSNMVADGVPLNGAPPVTISANTTGRGGAGIISITGPAGGAADTVALSNTTIDASLTDAAIPTPRIRDTFLSTVEQTQTAFPGFTPADPSADVAIAITANKVVLVNGTVLKADTTGGADAGAITLSVGTLNTQSGPDGRVLISSMSNCGQGCAGGQAGDIMIQGIPGVTPTVTQGYVWVVRPNSGPTEVFTYHLANGIDLHGTDIRADASGSAAGGTVVIRAQDHASFTDTNISVTTQDFSYPALKPNGALARNEGASRIDIMAQNIALKDSTISADAKVSDPAACLLCLGGPNSVSAGEIWLRAGNSVTLDNSSITNTASGQAQAGIIKIIKDNHFSFGAIWEPDYPDTPTGTARFTNSSVTVQALNDGLPGFLRIRADNLILDHSVLNSKVNNVSGQFGDVVGAGERSRANLNGRDVQGSIVVSAKNLDIIGGGIIAPTLGNRIGSRIEIHAEHLTTQPGTRPGGTLANPQILDPTDPTRVVISSGSTGSGGAGSISIVGEQVPMPEECCTGLPRGGWPPASSIHLSGTDVLTNSGTAALGGKIELKASGPIQLDHTTISSNVHDVRPQSLGVTDQGGTITLSAGSLSMQSSAISSISTGTQNGGNIVIAAQESVNAGAGSTISASNTGTANAGNIAINSGNQFVMTNSSVTTEATQAGGGLIKITTTPSGGVQLTNSKISASVLDGNGGGGSVNIDPQFVVLQNSQILAQAVQGPGGNISITTNLLLPDSTSIISASSQFGQQGTIAIQSPIAPAGGKVFPLPQKPLIATTLLGQRCAAIAGGNISSFTVAGRDSLPAEPGGWVSSPLALATIELDGRPVTETNQGEPAQEAPILSLRRIAPLGFLTQSFARDSGCTS